MKDSARYQYPISSARPRGVCVIESHSAKFGPRLQCFGEGAFRQWECGEAGPSIAACCERTALHCEAVIGHDQTAAALPFILKSATSSTAKAKQNTLPATSNLPTHFLSTSSNADTFSFQ